jgi:fatty-acyl-CoA synthase
MSSIVNGITTTYPFILPETVSTLKSIQNEKCTALKAAPVMFIDILNNPDLANYNLSSLESMLIGASTVPKDLLIKVKQRLNLKHVIIGYALTESG